MRNLKRPRGKGYSLRMATPEALVGTESPWTGKAFGREITLGLNTRGHAEALRIRDVRIGQIRQLEAEALAAGGIGGIIDLSPEAAEEWRQMRADASDDERGGMDHVLVDQLEAAAKAGQGSEAKAFGARVFKGAMPLQDALEKYLTEREPGNVFGFDPLAKTTALNVRSTVRHLREFLGGQQAHLQDVTPDQAFRFRIEYLPVEKGLAAGTVAKHVTLLRGMWAWAIRDKGYLKTRSGKPIRNPWDVAPGGTPKKAASRREETKRSIYAPEQVTKLLEGYPEWGTRQGDILRLLLVTGCRADEIGALALRDVAEDGTGFDIVKGKTMNATRHVPLASKAQDLLRYRIGVAMELQVELDNDERRLFPEWSLKPSTGKANGLSQWFTRYRRQRLGAQSDGVLALHSFRHTWRTVARRAGVADDRVRDLGGWGDGTDDRRSSANTYDHGLERQQLHDAQQSIWDGLEERGYLGAF
ncbi:site-specific integrase [Roseovarius sp. LXJ103]|uniref:site-specific integrase n=1 Tax=Roseovarius carneus TaxID=2853164 RepID=UPI0015E8279E|nr:site-specific integrase [Roseovarius carneus]MBZ8119748.1 site-specific integrase [Roseovarius carneus]